MKRLKYVLAALPTLLFMACGGGNTATQDGLTGKVTMDGYEGKQVYLETTSVPASRVDSALVKDGKFSFTFTDSIPQVYNLVLVTSSDDVFPIILPVVSEKGHVQVSMGEYVLTQGTPMNDSLQDFLLAMSTLTDKAMQQEKPDMEKVRADFAKLVEGAILQNIQTPVGIYIYRMYADRLDDAQRETILSRADNSFKEAVKE